MDDDFYIIIDDGFMGIDSPDIDMGTDWTQVIGDAFGDIDIDGVSWEGIVG